MPNTVIALDYSVRTTDADGRLHIAKSHISKANVRPYYGREIPDSEALRLDPDKIYQLLLDPQELAAGASTFARLPILSKHQPILNPDQYPSELVIGAIGSDVEFTDPYLDADLCFWHAEAIVGIETDTVRELSAAFRYVAMMTPGTYQAVAYDGIMTQIRGNHLALVESGRAGSDVLAADEAIKTMKTTKLGKALFVTLGGMSTKLAQDSALHALVGNVTKKTFNKGEVSAKLIAMDADLDPKQLGSTLDALLALDAEDDEHPKDCDCKKCKMAKDEAEEEERKKKVAEDAEKDEKVEAAMDSFKKDLRDADEARRAVRSVVGDVIAQDSAEDIYGFALDHLKVDRKGVTGVPALKALFTLASSRTDTLVAHIAQDSAGLVTKFPNATRFRQQ